MIAIERRTIVAKNKKEKKRKFGKTEEERLGNDLYYWVTEVWDGGPIPREIFTAAAMMIPQPIMEVVTLRRAANGKIEILLTYRDNDDPIWPGQLHNVGTARRKGDYKNIGLIDPDQYAFDRIQNELGIKKFAGPPVYVKTMHVVSERGPARVDVYLADVDASSITVPHEWVPVDKLSTHPNFIKSQRPHINVAVRSWSNRQRQKNVRKRA